MSKTFYYHIWVRSVQFRGDKPLTYKHTTLLARGALVIVPLREQSIIGIVSEEVSRPAFTTKSVLSVLDVPNIPDTLLKLGSWLHAFYPAPLGVITTLLVPRIITTRADRAKTTSLADKERITEPPLTADQLDALQRIQEPNTYLLHGRTGSGKTRIYTDLSARTIATGRSVMVLSPEIGLTSQLAINFKRIFGDQVVVIHSRLSAKERQQAWLHILGAETPLIVIGPRSVLFTPTQNLGLIIVDEFHDQAYKSEQAPYYQGVRVASQLRELHRAMLILGSATPPVADYHLAKEKKKPVIRLKNLAQAENHARKVTLVDLKDRDQFVRSPHLSLPLIESISLSLARGEQSLLYLNRRGTARVVLCQRCGWQAACSNCDTPLVYHADTHTLRCHICGRVYPTTTNCPDCKNPSVTFRSFGTKAIVEEVKHLFPEARTVRFDTDNLKADRLEAHYEDIVAGDLDILIGTQMLTKGLDLPRLSTLGVILADSSLFIPDYTAHERMYQLITQVIGRIGRGHVKSHAIIQTYQPNSELLRAAAYDEWDIFYQSEIEERKKYLFPPFCHLLKLTCARASSLSAEKAAQQLKKELQGRIPTVQIEGPAPSFHEKSQGKYTWQLTIKSGMRSSLLQVVDALPASGWTYDLDPTTLL